MALIAEQVEETLLIIGQSVGLQPLEFREEIRCGRKRGIQVARVHPPAPLKIRKLFFNQID